MSCLSLARRALLSTVSMVGSGGRYVALLAYLQTEAAIEEELGVAAKVLGALHLGSRKWTMTDREEEAKKGRGQICLMGR